MFRFTPAICNFTNLGFVDLYVIITLYVIRYTIYTRLVSVIKSENSFYGLTTS